MRSLNKTVVAGGVVYPTGTPATANLEALIGDEHWDGPPSAPTAGGDTPAVPYLDLKKAELEDEIESRNADRDPDGDDYIHVEAPGNKPELAAALEADDARTSGDD